MNLRLRQDAPARRARAIQPPSASFALFPRYRVTSAEGPPGPLPAALHTASRDPFITVQRKLDLLARVLANPKPWLMRMARRLPRRLMVIGWRPPKRLPSGPVREILEETLSARREARFQLEDFRRRTRNSEEGPTSAPAPVRRPRLAPL